MEEKITRLPAFSGTFYPEEKDKLSKMIDTFFANSENKYIDNIKALIVPHAGYVYSGQIATDAFIQLGDYSDIKRVVVIGPSHNEYLDCFGLSHDDIWQTPLGDIELDKDFITKLDNLDGFEYRDDALQDEHSLEVQLPFLQRILKKGWKLVPIITGQVYNDKIKTVAISLNSILDKNTILVVSTDLSHYYSKEEAHELDNKCIESIKKLEFDDECEACGEIGVKLLFEIAKLNNWKGDIIKYGDSGDVTGDDSSVVGYVSAIFMK